MVSGGFLIVVHTVRLGCRMRKVARFNRSESHPLIFPEIDSPCPEHVRESGMARPGLAAAPTGSLRGATPALGGPAPSAGGHGSARLRLPLEPLGAWRQMHTAAAAPAFGRHEKATFAGPELGGGLSGLVLCQPAVT